MENINFGTAARLTIRYAGSLAQLVQLPVSPATGTGVPMVAHERSSARPWSELAGRQVRPATACGSEPAGNPIRMSDSATRPLASVGAKRKTTTFHGRAGYRSWSPPV